MWQIGAKKMSCMIEGENINFKLRAGDTNEKVKM
jgi:hypothetical protein